MATPAGTIDITPTWGEWGIIYRRFAESGERKAITALREDLARAMASCQALNVIGKTLTDEQRAIVSRVIVEELTKAGY